MPPETKHKSMALVLNRKTIIITFKKNEEPTNIIHFVSFDSY